MKIKYALQHLNLLWGVIKKKTCGNGVGLKDINFFLIFAFYKFTFRLTHLQTHPKWNIFLF